MSEWQRKPLGDLVLNFDAKRVPLSGREREEHRGKFPYYGATGVIDYVDTFLFEGLHLLVAEDGSVERPDGMPFVQLVDGQFWVNNHAHVLRAQTNDDTKFLYYALQTLPIRPFMSGSVQAKLSQANLNRIPVPYTTDEAERRAIAEVLGALDDKIEANEKLARTAAELAFAWASNLLSSVEGPTVALEQVADIVKGVSYRSDELIPGDGWLVNLKCFGRDGTFQVRGLKPYSGQAKTSQVVEPGDVVVAQTDVTQRAEVIGRPIRIESAGRTGRLVASLDCVIVRPRDGLTREFIFAVLSQQAFRDHVLGYCNGTTVLHMNSRAVPSYEFVMPSTDVVHEISTVMALLLERASQAREESTALIGLRDTLLSKLLSGELRVTLSKADTESLEAISS